MRIKIYDIETIVNLFTYIDIDRDSREINKFILHEDLFQLREFIDYLDNKVDGMVGFNNLGFDYPIIHLILKNKRRFLKLAPKQVIDSIYNKAQDIIGSQDDFANRFKHSISEKNMIIPQLDLFKIWHFDNKAKMTSLKKVQIAIDWINVEDMPIPHDVPVTFDQIEEVLRYNLNDVLSTDAFYSITKGLTENKLYKGVDKIKLRSDIEDQFNIKCSNFNDVRIGDEINKTNYLKATGLEWYDIKELRTLRPVINFRECIPDFIKFESQQLNMFLEKLKNRSVSGSKQEFKEKVIYKGVVFTFAQGGIHSVDDGRKVIPKEDEILEDRDCASMYPFSIINWKLFPAHLGIEWLNGYTWIRDERVNAKVLYKQNKDPKYQAIQEAYKLALNGGGYGKTGEPNSWQYDPMVTMYTTIGNQLCLLMLCEKYLNNGIRVVSANTDGVLILYRKDQKSIVENIDKEWQETTKHMLEYTLYRLFAQSSVNDYIAVKPDGEVKYKGDFDPYKEIHKDHSFRIVPIAISEYFVNNIPVEETIKKHTNIYNFCGRETTSKDCYSEIRYIDAFDSGPELIRKRQQKNTRYYISIDGCKFVRVYKTGKKAGQDEMISKGYVVTIFNKYFEKPISEYNIDYSFYIKEAYKIINVVENNNQLNLF